MWQVMGVEGSKPATVALYSYYTPGDRCQPAIHPPRVDTLYNHHLGHDRRGEGDGSGSGSGSQEYSGSGSQEHIFE